MNHLIYMPIFGKQGPQESEGFQISLMNIQNCRFPLGLSDSGKITITVDSCELFTIYDTITINYNIIVNNL